VYTLHDDNSPRTSIVLRLSCPLTVGSRDGNAVHRIILLEHRLRKVELGGGDAVHRVLTQRASYRQAANERESVCDCKNNMCICISTHQKPFTRSPPPYVHQSAVSALAAPVWKQKSSHEPQRSQQLISCISSPDNPLTNSRGRGFVTAKACICVSLVKGCQHIKRRTGQAVVTPMGSDS
jgi:hypothetical protein